MNRWLTIVRSNGRTVTLDGLITEEHTARIVEASGPDVQIIAVYGEWALFTHDQLGRMMETTGGGSDA